MTRYWTHIFPTIAVAGISLLSRFEAHGEEIPDMPGPVEIPVAPHSLSDLPEFERKLALVKNAFWEYKRGDLLPTDGVGAIFLETAPQQVPLGDGKSIVSCDDFLDRLERARKAWDEVTQNSRMILAQTESLRKETDDAAISRGFEKIEALVDLTSAQASKVARDFPATLFSVPDRLIQYRWKIEPQRLFQSWQNRWHLEGTIFNADILSLPGYTWMGQGLITAVAQVTRAPYFLGQDIIFERVASPVSACKSETIWMSGAVVLTYKRPFQGMPGCVGGEDCSTVPLDPIIHREPLTVTLQGRLDPHRPDLSDTPSWPKCPGTPFSLMAKSPVNCPN